MIEEKYDTDEEEREYNSRETLQYIQYGFPFRSEGISDDDAESYIDVLSDDIDYDEFDGMHLGESGEYIDRWAKTSDDTTCDEYWQEIVSDKDRFKVCELTWIKELPETDTVKYPLSIDIRESISSEIPEYAT